MDRSLWIIVPNWERYQHYRDRSPSWIKLYQSLLDDPDFQRLSLADLGILVIAWLLYARMHCQIRVSDVARFVPSVSHHTTYPQSLERLNHAGFIELSASRPLALEKRREEKKERASKKPVENRPGVEARKARAWIRNGLAAEVPMDRLGDVLAEEFKISDPSLLKDLVAQAREHQ